MVAATEFHQLSPPLRIWHAYDPSVKAELFSTAVSTPAGVLVVDPIPLAADAVTQLGDVAAIIVTNANHHRASADFSARLKVPIRARAETFGQTPPRSFEQLTTESLGDSGGSVVAIDGAPVGEIALCFDRTLIVGDALINFEPHGFGLLPAKYCTDFKRMRRSLRELLALDFDRILFAHGFPIMSGGHARLAALLDQ